MEPVLLTEGFPTVCLYPATSPERPLIVLNSFAEEGDRVAEACSDLDLSLLILRDLHWDDDLSPWPAPALSKKDPPFSGGADAHLARIREEFLPEARRRIPGDPSFTAIAADGSCASAGAHLSVPGGQGSKDPASRPPVGAGHHRTSPGSLPVPGNRYPVGTESRQSLHRSRFPHGAGHSGDPELNNHPPA